MGALLSRRVGTETYYANYEKAFERLEKESSKVLDRRVKRRKTMEACSNIGFWVTGLALCAAVIITAWLQRIPDQKWYRKSMTILACFAVPLVAALLFRGILWLMRFSETRDERFLRKLMDAKRKMVKELKDSTRFDKTMALIRKYDPDEQVPSPKAGAVGPTPPGTLRRRSTMTASGASAVPSAIGTPGARTGTMTPGGMLLRCSSAAATATANMAAGTGKALMPVFESLATNLVGDNPVLLQQAQQLVDENNALKKRLADLEAKVGAAANGNGDGSAPATPAEKPKAKAG